MKGFNNPHDGVMNDGVTLIDPYHHNTFEAGGQEMLRCLKENGWHIIMGDTSTRLIPNDRGGYLLFIEEE